MSFQPQQTDKISAVKSHSHRRLGFTLIEILVAMVVIGVIVSIAVLSIGDPASDKLREETRRLAAVIDLAQEEAILQSRDFGITFWQQGYAFYEFFEGKWLKVEKDRVLRSYQLPQGMRVQLVLEGIDVVMSAVELEKPQIFILSSGEISQFKLQLKFLDMPAFFTRLSTNEIGAVEYTDSEQEKDAEFKPSKKI